MQEDRGNKLSILFSTIQYILLIIAVACIGISITSNALALNYIAIGLLVFVLALNLLRLLLGLNLFAVPRESKYQTVLLFCQLSGLTGIIIVWLDHIIVGLLLVLLALTFQYCTRYGVWSLFEDAKYVEYKVLRNRVFTFFLIFAGLMIVNFISDSHSATTSDITYDFVLSWLVASFILGLKCIHPIKENMASELNTESKKIRSRLLVIILKVFSLGKISDNFSQTRAIKIFSALTTTIVAPIIGGMLAPFYTIIYVSRLSNKP